MLPLHVGNLVCLSVMNIKTHIMDRSLCLSNLHRALPLLIRHKAEWASASCLEHALTDVSSLCVLKHVQAVDGSLNFSECMRSTGQAVSGGTEKDRGGI